MDSIGLPDINSVSVVILAKNEEKTIGDAVKAALPYAHEVIVMDGRSTDATAARAMDGGAIVYEDAGKGKGAAIRQSLHVAHGEIVVFMDADGSHDTADIPRLLEPIMRREAELCVGSRFAGGSDELSATVGQLIRTIGNISMNIAINKRWSVELTDTLNGFRAIRRSVALELDLRENRHTIEQEMVMQVLRRGYRVVNVASHEYQRQFGRSHINIWREWPLFVWCVLRQLWYRSSGPGPARRITRGHAGRSVSLEEPAPRAPARDAS